MAQKNKIYIFLGIFAAIIIAAIVFGIIPLYNGITKNASDFLSAKEKIASLDAQMQDLGSLKSQYNQYSPGLDKINLLFVNHQVPIDFIEFMEQLASSSDVDSSISPSAGLRGGSQQWQSLDFNLTVNGSYQNFSRFLDKLENAPYLIEVQGLDVKSLGNQNVEASIAIKVFAK